MAGWTAIIAAVLLLAACGNRNDRLLQGWVEADLIFVGPDENGRLETLAVREGDQVESGALLFTLDSELQQADVMQAQATVTNTRQALDRAAALLKTNAGTQKSYEDAEAALRTAQGRLNSAQTRLARRRMAKAIAQVRGKSAEATDIAPHPVHRFKGRGMIGIGFKPCAKAGFVGGIAVLGMQPGQPSGGLGPHRR